MPGTSSPFSRWSLVRLLMATAAVAVVGLPGSAAPVPRTTALSAELGRDVEGPLPRGAVARLGSHRFRHAEMVWCLAFSPDGKVLASGGGDEVVRFWDLRTGRLLRTSSRYHSCVSWLAYSPDGATLAVRDRNAILPGISLLDARTGTERTFVSMSEGAIPLMTAFGGGAFSPDGRTLAASTPAGEVRLYDPTGGAQIAVLGKHDHTNVPRLVFSPDGRTLASAGQDRTIRLWDVVRLKPLFVLRPEDTYTFAIAFSRDGKQLFTGGGTQENPNDEATWKHPAIRVWDVATGKQLRLWQDVDLRGPIHSVALSPDGRTLAASCRGTLRLWDVKTGKIRRTLAGLRGQYWSGGSLQFSPNGRLLAGTLGNTVGLWEVSSGRLLTLDATEAGSSVTALDIRDDGRLLAAGDADGSLALWDLRTHQLVRRWRGHTHPVRTIVFAPDAKSLASRSEQGHIRVWDAGGGRQRYQYPAGDVKDSLPTCLAFSPDGALLASPYFSNRPRGGPCGVRLLDAVTGEVRQNLILGEAHDCRFHGVAFSRDGRRLIATTTNGETYGWRKGEDGFRPDGVIHQFSAFSRVAHLPDGLLITMLHPQTEVARWDFTARKEHRTLTDRFPLQCLMAASRDGRYIAAGLVGAHGDDSNGRHGAVVGLWEAASGREVLTWQLQPYTATRALAFTPDGRTLIAGLSDTTVLLWDIFPAAKGAADDLPAAWAALTGNDARRAHRAVAALLAAGDRGVTFLADRLRPAQAPPAQQVQRWIADLDSDEFAVRERATRALTEAVETIRPALRRARADRPALEQRRRLDALLEIGDPERLTGGALRDIRAITALQYLATPEARRLLRRLAEGAPEARRTRAARAALAITGERPAPPAPP